jgi:hypothetical protein
MDRMRALFVFKIQLPYQLIFALLLVCLPTMSAQYHGMFQYTDHGSYIEIIRVYDNVYPFPVPHVVFPSSINGKPVTHIGNDVMGSFMSELQSIIIPEGITHIGIVAFWRINAPFTISLPSTLKHIGREAFAWSAIAEINLPAGLETIGNGAFLGSGLTAVTIPGTVNQLGVAIFLACNQLQSATLGEGVAVISSGMFDGCSNLTAVTLPSSIQHIGDRAFFFVHALQSILLPEGLQTIGEEAFAYTGIANITIPSTVTFIGNRAFTQSGLTSIAFAGNAPTVDCHVFGDSLPDTLLTYPLGAQGFIMPEWNGYRTLQTGGIHEWMHNRGVDISTNILADLNGDGRSLLEIYAFGLDSEQPVSNRPRLEMTASALNLTFFAGAPGVDYLVEYSDDLKVWQTDFVSVGAPDAEGRVNASVPLGTPARFMRVQLSY